MRREIIATKLLQLYRVLIPSLVLYPVRSVLLNDADPQ
jgi:hypothetical protein